MKQKIIATSVVITLLLVAFAQCKKEKNPMNGPEATVPAQDGSNLRQVPNRDLKLSSQQVRAVSARFKAHNNGTLRSTDDIYEIDSLELASANYLLEAVLNFDYDEPIDTFTVYDASTLTYTFETSANSDYISGETLVSIYETAYAAIGNIRTDDNRIAAIDVEVFEVVPGETHGVFSLKIVAPISGGGNCSEAPFANPQQGFPDFQYHAYAQVYIPSQCVSSNWPNYKVLPPLLSAQVNCNDLVSVPDCLGPDLYYQNILSSAISGLTYPNVLWYKKAVFSNFCNGTVMFGAVADTYLSNFRNYVNSLSQPFIYGSANVGVGKTSMNPQTSEIEMYWTLSCATGQCASRMD